MADELSSAQVSRLGRNTLLFSLPTILSGIASFVMLPVYTRYLTPADYGLLAMVNLALEIALLVFSAGATAGVMRFYFKTHDALERNRVVFTAWSTSLGLYGLGAFALYLASPAIWEHVLNGAGTLQLVQLASVNFALSAITLVPLQVMAIEQRALPFAVIMIVRLLLQVGFNLLYVVQLQSGPIGFVWSTFWSSLLLGLPLGYALLRRTGFSWSWQAFHDLRRFSLPIQLSKAGTFFLAYGDRFFLQKYHGLATVGLYGLAYQFGFFLYGTLATPFFQAWTPQRFQIADEEHSRRDAITNRGFLLGDLVIVAGAVAISLFIRPALMILTTPEFHPAAALVPVIVLAYALQAWAIAVDFGIEFTERTKYTSHATWISVAVITVLYLTLIPRYGGMGAAIASLVAMAVRFGATLYFAQKLLPIRYVWHPHIRLIAGGAIVTLAALFVPAKGLAQTSAVAALMFLLWLLGAWAGVLDQADRAALHALVRSPRSWPRLLRGE